MGINVLELKEAGYKQSCKTFCADIYDNADVALKKYMMANPEVIIQQAFSYTQIGETYESIVAICWEK